MENTTNTAVQETMENAAEAVQKVLPEAGKTIGLKEIAIGTVVAVGAYFGIKKIVQVFKENKAKKVTPAPEVPSNEQAEPKPEATEEDVKSENLN